MLTLSKPVTALWKTVLRQNFTHWEKLADFLELDPAQRASLAKNSRFPLNLPLRLAQKMPKGSLEDPIVKQFLPVSDEQMPATGFSPDPVGHNSCRKAAKLVHKYHGRALLRCTSACAMHCRYCYMQHFPYDCQDKTFDREVELLQNDPSIKEVILSGGDPLSLDDRILEMLLGKLGRIPHLKHIRFHSRFPIGIPERISDEFLSIFDDTTQNLWFVIHCNHPRELDPDVIRHLNKLKRRGFTLLNQAVLLKGVNDNTETQKELCEKLIDNQIIPYYLHQLDRVQGAAHFEVPEEQGRRLIKELMYLLPGYAVPKYVREIPGVPCKVWLI